MQHKCCGLSDAGTTAVSGIAPQLGTWTGDGIELRLSSGSTRVTYFSCSFESHATGPTCSFDVLNNLTEPVLDVDVEDGNFRFGDAEVFIVGEFTDETHGTVWVRWDQQWNGVPCNATSSDIRVYSIEPGGVSIADLQGTWVGTAEEVAVGELHQARFRIDGRGRVYDYVVDAGFDVSATNDPGADFDGMFSLYAPNYGNYGGEYVATSGAEGTLNLYLSADRTHACAWTNTGGGWPADFDFYFLERR